MNVLPMEKRVRVIACLTEGNSVRSASRLTDVNRTTVMRLGVEVGEGCHFLHDALFRDLNVPLLELDEMWSFIGCKAKRKRADHPEEYGDSWVYIGLDAVNKAIISFVVGKRDGDATDVFCMDLRKRILNRPQITSDGFSPYVDAVDRAFGMDVDFAQLVKQYGGDPQKEAARRYSPGHVIGARKVPVMGNPNEEYISTSYVERSNLELRMKSRRFTRLTNAFSKKGRNHAAAVALHVAYYNLCWVHSTIRMTPAMALGVTDHIWTIEELVRAALSAGQAPPPALPEVSLSSSLAGPPQLRVIQGGRA